MNKWMSKLSTVLPDYNNLTTTFRNTEVTNMLGISIETLRRLHINGIVTRDINDKYTAESLVSYFNNQVELSDIIKCRYVNIKVLSIKYNLKFKDIYKIIGEPSIISVTQNGYYDKDIIGDKLNIYNSMSDNELLVSFKLIQEAMIKKNISINDNLL
jgi:hypothetical protein